MFATFLSKLFMRVFYVNGSAAKPPPPPHPHLRPLDVQKRKN